MKQLEMENLGLKNTLGTIRTPWEILKNLHGVSLYRNAVYLILTNAVLAITGFLFWIAAARLYPAEAVGVASAAVAAMLLMMAFSTIGLDFALIRFLPATNGKSGDVINSCFTVSGLVSLCLAVVFIAGLDLWSPALLIIRENIAFGIVFVLSVVAGTIFILSGRIFVAKRKSGFTLMQGMVLGLSRFVPLIVLAAFFEAFGMFFAWGAAFLVAASCALSFMIPRVEPGYRPSFACRKSMVLKLLKFSLPNYFAHLCLAATQFVLPIIVINRLSAEENAYFYVAWTLGYVLFMIPVAISFSLFAEGSNNENGLKDQVMKSLKLLMVTVVPAVALVILVGDKVLLLFGTEYSENATHLLRILAVSAVPFSLTFVYFGIRRVQMKMKSVVWLSFFMVTIVLGLSYVLLPRMGIEGGGIAWFISQCILAVLIIAEYLIRRTRLFQPAR